MKPKMIDFRIRAAKAKARNIVYYRKLDQQLRPRVTYIHVLRDYRKNLLELVEDLPLEKEEDIKFFKGIIDLINPKVKTEDCTAVIIEIEKYVLRFSL